ncbi:MAG: outer membrane beta-barrel protein [Bacteroidota bacterium]
MKSFILFFLFQFLMVTTVLSQIEKGDALLDLGGFYQRYKTFRTYQFFPRHSLSVRYGRMFSDHFMAGLGVSHFSSEGSDGFYGQQKVRSIEVDPFVRYYFFRKNKFMPYVFAGADYTHYTLDTEALGVVYQEGRIQVSAGMGLDYFITQNVALEAEAGTLVFDHKNAVDNGDLVFARLGWKTFLADVEKTETPLSQRFVRKGNAMIEGGFELTENYNTNVRSVDGEEVKAKPSEFQLEIDPEIQYFVSDQLAIRANPFWSRFGNGNRKNRRHGINLGIAPHCSISDHLFFIPAFSYGFGWEKYSQYVTQGSFINVSGTVLFRTEVVEQSEKIRERYGQLQMAFKYITDNSFIATAGGVYNWTKRVEKRIVDRQSSDAELEWFVDVELFIAPNISFSNRLNYRKSMSVYENKLITSFPNDDSTRRFTSTFAVRFYIFNED